MEIAVTSGVFHTGAQMDSAGLQTASGWYVGEEICYCAITKLSRATTISKRASDMLLRCFSNNQIRTLNEKRRISCDCNSTGSYDVSRVVPDGDTAEEASVRSYEEKKSRHASELLSMSKLR